MLPKEGNNQQKGEISNNINKCMIINILDKNHTISPLYNFQTTVIMTTKNNGYNNNYQQQLHQQLATSIIIIIIIIISQLQNQHNLITIAT